jgi:hypothetical protein
MTALGVVPTSGLRSAIEGSAGLRVCGAERPPCGAEVEVTHEARTPSCSQVSLGIYPSRKHSLLEK